MIRRLLARLRRRPFSDTWTYGLAESEPPRDYRIVEYPNTLYIDGIGRFAPHSGPQQPEAVSGHPPTAPASTLGHVEGRHTDGSCAVCRWLFDDDDDWLDESPVPGYRRSGRC